MSNSEGSSPSAICVCDPTGISYFMFQ
jgi:hypothetical protein